MANDANEVGYLHKKTGAVTFVPSAYSVEVAYCDEKGCDHLHLFLLDQMDQPIAEATISDEFIDQLVEWKNRRLV
jgi:hypothetical protein